MKIFIRFLFLVVFTLNISLLAQYEADVVEISNPVKNIVVNQNPPLPVYNPSVTVLYDNGPLVTHPGLGYNGADGSALQTLLGLNTYGFGNQYLNGYRMADDFEIPSQLWRIDSIVFFTYQTNAVIDSSTTTGIYLQIWNGPPNDPTRTVVWGDLTTNRLVNTYWSGIYRTRDVDSLSYIRPIMANVADIGGTFFAADTYWIDWTTHGTLASGPWAPPISILGQTVTGNAMQYTTAWADALDTGLGTQQGMPFIIYGTITTSVEPKEILPTNYSLEQNYPNPFNPSTTIRFSIPNQSDVSIKVFNTLGQEVADLVNKNLNAGNHEIKFNAQNLVSGMYIYKMQSVDIDGKLFEQSKKMLLLK
ncbi:MAG: T9SS type A sorting domain-containing protein [Ignavibacteriales bacterium]|nr:T9SS type A sorting domain-containing protein [Ignavibacteriales bacterium]